MLWSGNRTRNSRINSPMLYPIELSNGGRTGFEPVANGLRRCSASELPSSRNTFSHASAYATATPRAPDGIASRTAVACSIDVPYCRLSPTGNPCRRIAPYALQTQPRAARVEASPRGAHAPVAAAPLPRARSIARPDASGRKTISLQTGFAELSRCMRFLCERWKQNAPGFCDPRAFALPREIGVADLPGSPTVIRCAVYRLRSPGRRSLCFVHARASAPRLVGHSAKRIALTKFGFMGSSDVAKNAARAKAAHDTLLIFDAQLFFNIEISSPTNGCNEWANDTCRCKIDATGRIVADSFR